MAKPVTKYANIVLDANMIKYELELAYHEAVSGRPGPVWLDIPLDIQDSQVDESQLLSYQPEADEKLSRGTQLTSDVKSAIEMLKNAKRPLLLCGNGIHLSKSEELLKKLINKLNIPVVLPDAAKDLIAEEHPLYMGVFGTAGQRRANFAVQNSDCILSLGAGLCIKKVGFFLIAGPCVVENEDFCFEIATRIKDLAHRLEIPYIFKASFRKANRTRLVSFTSIGDEKALNILKKVGVDLNLPVITDIHESHEAEMAANFVDTLQIPAFLCRQTDLLVAAAKTEKTINIKKGQFLSPEAMKFAVNKVRDAGNLQVMITERGTMLGYQDIVVDFRGIPVMAEFRCSGCNGHHPFFATTLAYAPESRASTSRNPL